MELVQEVKSASDELFLYGVTSKVTSDCLVDRLVGWWESVKERFPHIKTLLINLDNVTHLRVCDQE